eukprot:COSAG01_NODE_4623_length_4868_cov_3.974837_1_plen_56_part_00
MITPGRNVDASDGKLYARRMRIAHEVADSGLYRRWREPPASVTVAWSRGERGATP